MGEALAAASAEHLWDEVALAVSEVVTNAVVHAGSHVGLRAFVTSTGVRVEVDDNSSHLPVVRRYAASAGTGRGLHLVDACVDAWGVTPTASGKTVWFEIGEVDVVHRDTDAQPAARQGGRAAVTLLDVPLLMHWAWQEHAQALLREYLLFALEDDPLVVERHAASSQALALLAEQLPVPALPDDPDALLANTLEPGVTAAEVTIEVAVEEVANFVALDHLLASAVEAAEAGKFLGPATQPEISEMREWICEEVARQAAGEAPPTAWRSRTDVRRPVDGERDLPRLSSLTGPGSSALVTDEASVIVAVSARVAHFLGYRDASGLLGRRVIVVVPHRYHQAHIAGTTLNATNGRDKLLGVPITVPVVRADGSEVPVELLVRPHLLDGTRLFVAEMTLDAEQAPAQ